MKFSILILAVLAISCSSHKDKKEKKQVQAEVAFEVTEGILHPESVIYSAQHKSFFSTNVASGNPTETKRVSYLSKISEDGKTVEAKWVVGLKAPKGLTLVGDDLYLTDVNEIVRVSIAKKKITKTWPVKNSKFMNDTAVDAQGNVYASDMFSDTIHKISKDKLSVWVKDARIAGSNGLFTDGKEHMISVKWGTEVDSNTFMAKNIGDIAVIPLNNISDIQLTKELQGHLDGIAADAQGTLWISDWISGDVYAMKKNGKTKKMYNFGQGTADISVAKELNLLLVPQMGQNKLMFIKL